MVDPDIVYAKIGNIQRCLVRIRTVTKLKPESLDEWDIQDVVVLNLQRAAQSAIDLASHLIATGGLGLPDSLADHFVLLRQADIISGETAQKMIGMVGFRNIAVHDYQELDIDILKNILTDHLDDFEQYYRAVLIYTDLNGRENGQEDNK